MKTMETVKTMKITPPRSALSAALLLLLAAAPPVEAQGANPPLLVEPGWLASHLGEAGLVVLQVGPEEVYAEEHVPGARWIQRDDFSRPMPEDGNHAEHLVLELPEPDALRSALVELGVTDASRIVVVPSAGWVTPAARMVFTLDWAGLGDRVGLLDGGLEGWKAAGHPVTSDEPEPAVEGGPLTLTPRGDRVVSAEWIRSRWVEAGTSVPDGFVLVDARPGAFYDGVREDRGKAGHVPGAGSLPWLELFDETEDGVVTLASPDRVRSLLAEAGVGPGDTVVAYCHIGQYATAVLFAARTVGHDVRLFDGSMNQWALLDLPVEAARRERP